MMRLVDHRAMAKLLLEAQPGSSAVTTCYRCGRRILDRLAGLDERGFFVHQTMHPVPEAAR